MNTRATTWAAWIVTVLVLMASGTASASSVLLSPNSCQENNRLEQGWHRASSAVSGESHRGCVGSCSFDAAGLFVAPGARVGPRSPTLDSPHWPDPPAHITRQAEEVSRRLRLPDTNVAPGTERVIRVRPGERAPIDESDFMALAEWHRREISVSVVRLRDGTLNYHVGYGFATEGTPLLDQAIVTARYGEGATLLRTLHTQPGGVLRPSSADLWIALERPTGTEIIARNAANGEVIHHHITQQRAAELIRNRMRSSPTGPEGGLERINPAELTLQQRQMLERVLGYRPPELP